MILRGETRGYAAEVSFNLPLETNPLTGLTGHVFTLGEVKMKFPVNPTVWVDIDPIRIIEKGYGRFAVQLTPSELSVAGTAVVNVEVAGTQPYRGSISIGDIASGDISVGGTGWLVLYLADATDPLYNAPLTGAFNGLAGAVARVCWPDASYVDVDLSTVHEFGNGLFGIPASSVNTTKPGTAYYYATATGAQPFESYSTIAEISAIAPVTTPVLPLPVESPYTPDSPLYLDHVLAAINRLPEQFKAKA